jgi:hypothetical protein
VREIEAMDIEQEDLGLVDASSDNLWGNINSRMEMPPTPTPDVYEIRPRKDRDGLDLTSDRLGSRPIWYAGPDAVRNAVAYAKYRSHSRSHRAIIRVFDEEGNVTATHEQKSDFRRRIRGLPRLS